MSWKQRILRGSGQVALGEAVGYAASFVRNMILARLLSKADFGIAATFAMMISLLEFSSRLGISRIVVRDKEGDDPAFVATAHMVQALTALVSALLMVGAAWPMSRVFGIPEHAPTLTLLAFIPLLLGFAHLDVRRFERQLNFAASTKVEVISQLVVTAVAWPITRAFGDFHAVLAILILKALVSCLASFAYSRQPYRWQYHREYALRMLQFGWPLIVNGFLMFCLVRGDQFIVATFYLKSDLGAFAAAAALTTAPTLFFNRVFASVVLPVMSKAQDDTQAFQRRYRMVIAVIAAFSAAYSAGVIIASEALMRLVYGTKYENTGIILAWITAANTVRTLRLAGAVAAMAKGDSKNEMISSLGGGLSLALSFAIAMLHFPVWCVACASLTGECVSCAISFWRLSRRDSIPLLNSVAPAGLVLLVATAVGSVASLGIWRLPVSPALLVGLLVAATAGALVTFSLGDSRREVFSMWRNLRTSGWRSVLSGERSPAHQASANP